jgi:O-phosphoseryl-tRNA(Cys) synthetase
MRVKKLIEVDIKLSPDKIEQIIIEDLKWHAEHAEDLEDVEALRRVLHYYKEGDENEL